MKTVKWKHAMLILGFLLATQPLAANTSAFDGMGGKSERNHRLLAIYYEEQAQLNKRQAERWDFLADYFEQFPTAFSGKLTAAEHVTHCRAMAEELRKAERQNHEFAVQQRSLMRKDFID